MERLFKVIIEFKIKNEFKKFSAYVHANHICKAFHEVYDDLHNESCECYNLRTITSVTVYEIVDTDWM